MAKIKESSPPGVRKRAGISNYHVSDLLFMVHLHSTIPRNPEVNNCPILESWFVAFAYLLELTEVSDCCIPGPCLIMSTYIL